MPDTNRLGKDDLGLGQAAGLFYIFMDNILQGIYRVTTKFSYNLNLNLWLIGSCE